MIKEEDARIARRRGRRAARFFRDNIVFHTHIEKTSGTSFAHGFVRALGKEHVHDTRPPQNPKPHFLSQEDKDRIFVLTGHFFYGTHDASFKRNKLYLACVRPPLERMRSYYYFVSTRPGHPGYHRTEGKTFAEFVDEQIRTRVPNPNPMSRVLAGSKKLDVPGLLAHVESNYLIVTPHDRINDTLAALTPLLQGEQPARELHLNKGTAPGEDETGDLEKRFRKAHATDYRLYHYVLERYEAWLDDLPARLETQSRGDVPKPVRSRRR